MPDTAPPTPPTADNRGALNAALDALGGNLAAAFARPRGFGLPALPPGIGVAPAWGDPEPAFGDMMRRHLDGLNRQLVTTGAVVDHLDETLALAIDAHLAECGLDNINPQQKNHQL